jgi:hypothetical protein
VQSLVQECAGDIDRGRIEPVSELHHNCTSAPQGMAKRQ